MPFTFKPVTVEPDPERVKRFNQALDRFNRLLDEAENASNGAPAAFASQAAQVAEAAINDLRRIEPSVTRPHEISAANNDEVANLQRRINNALDAASEFIDTQSLM